MLELDAPITHTITITYFDSTHIMEDGDCTKAITTAVVNKPNRKAAWKFIKDCERKATSTPTVALIQVTVEVDCTTVWDHDYWFSC